MATAHADGRVERGNQTRRAVLKRTVDIASVEGLEGLSLGRLAGELGLSKSGVFALFGSKEELQLATVRAALAVYLEHVVRPALDQPPGIGRLWTLCLSWLDYSEQRVFPGGCFFHSVTTEYAARPGPLHDALAQARTDWLAHLEQTALDAQHAKELRPGADVPQLVFEISALLEAANAESVLHNDFTCYGRATRAIATRLREASTTGSLPPGSLTHR